jgi:hypothetical protein
MLRLGQDTLPVFFSECLQKQAGKVCGFLEVSGSFEEVRQSDVACRLKKRVAASGGDSYGLQVGLTSRVGIGLFA